MSARRITLEGPAATDRAPQTPRNGLNAIIGRWPGDEDDDAVDEALEHISFGAEEIRRRLADLDAGRVTAVPWEEARRRIFAR